MTIRPPPYWNKKIAMAYLIQAASIHRRLPDVRGPRGYHSLWPETLKDEAERLCTLSNGRTTLGSPMPPEVSFQEETLEWLRYLDRRQQQLVFMRANRIPWKILVEDFGRSRATLSRELDCALGTLVSHLNRIDIRGEHFRRLRERAKWFLSGVETS